MFEPTKELSQKLIEEAGSCGISISKDQSFRLLTYLDLVYEKNKQLNLTSITELNAGLTLHIVDSLLFLNHLDGTTFCDMGTGAGFPGIPLALTTQSDAVLLDSVGKKVAAVNEFINTLGLGQRVSAVHDRVESFTLSHKFAFDSVVARALAPLPTLLEYASPLLHSNGSFIASKGPISDDEFQRGLIAAKLCGFTLQEHQVIELPHDSGTRTILKFIKDKPASVALPRKVGKAKNSPLA